MNRNQVCHIWAQQTKPHGKAGNIFFEGATIYSYGRHFPMARFIEHRGRRAVLFTTDTYSNSTGTHLSGARKALHGLNVPVFACPPDITAPPDSRKMQAHYAGETQSAVDKATRARRYTDSYMDSARQLAETGNACAEFFGWRWRLDVPALTPEYLAAAEAKRKAETAATKKRHAAAELKARKLADKARAAWIAGEYHGRCEVENGETLLRIRGDIVETSRGAQVPVSHCARIWRLVRRIMASGTPYQRNGHTEHAGEFAIDSIAVDGTMRAGCHMIGFPELQRIAGLLNLEGGAV